MTFLLVASLAWTAAAVPVGILLGRGLTSADAREDAARRRLLVPDHVPAELVRAVAAQERHRT